MSRVRFTAPSFDPEPERKQSPMSDKDKITGGCALIGCSFWFVLGLANAVWMDRTLDFWVSHFADKTVNVPFWQSGLFSILTGTLGCLLNILSEICRAAI